MTCKYMHNKTQWEKGELERILGVNSTIDEQLHYLLDNHGENADKLSKRYCREVCPIRYDCEDNSERRFLK